MHAAMAYYKVGGGCECGSAGCGCPPAGFFGGDVKADPAKELREYGASLSAKSKENVIRRLGRAMKQAGIKVDPDGDLDLIVAALTEQIPNPSQGGSFSSKAKDQEKICRIVGDALNDAFTPGARKPGDKLIDTSLSAVEVCRQVGEIAHSYNTGLSNEFLAVRASVQNALRNVEILGTVMDDYYRQLLANVADRGDAKLSRETEALREVYDRAKNERARQEEVLKNLLHVRLAPAADELEIALRSDSEQNALVKKLNLKPGTSEFGTVLAQTVSGLGSIAANAQAVNKALKEVSESVRAYMDSPSFKEFESKLDAKIWDGSVGADNLAKFLEAIDTLRRNFSRRAALKPAIEKFGATLGGAGEAKSEIQTKLEREKAERKLFVHKFATAMSRHYDELLAAVQAMAPELGGRIPLSAATDSLRDALIRLGDNRTDRFELSLMGLFADAQAREVKESYVSALRLVSRACDNIIGLEMYRGSAEYFNQLKAAIDALENTIDRFSDIIVKKYGRGEDGEVRGGACHGGCGGALGGADDDATLLPEIARSALNLKQSVNEFKYHYYVANVRRNLRQTSKELGSYGEKYTELLGDAAAMRLLQLDSELKLLTTESATVAGRITTTNRAALLLADEKELTAAIAWVKDEYRVKARFYKAVQAIDLYMRAFTDGIASDPDAVRDIKKMMDGTDVIARWFTDQTGNHIWRAFEGMGSVNSTNNAVALTAPAGAALPPDDGKHYYQKIGDLGAAAPAGATFGIPEVGVIPTNADKAKKHVSEAFDNFQSLKNLMNTFARIGDKFGGAELREKIFMSPGQIYKALTDYLKQSAMSIYVKDPTTTAPTGVLLAAQLQCNVYGGMRNVVQPYNVYFGSTITTVAGNYVQEDKYFSMIVKTMAAKVLTVLGVYDMFERTTPLYDLTPTRMIIGGGDSDPEPLEDAAELYFRLPRLAEYYRAHLRWDGSGTGSGTGGLRIAMMPDLDGIFSGIIRLTFQKQSGVETGDYTDTELRTLISEINSIFEFYRAKDAQGPAAAAIAGLVTEVNRRYGIVKKADAEAYWKLNKTMRDVATPEGLAPTSRLNETNYAILPGEADLDGEMIAPSDRYVTEKGLSVPDIMLDSNRVSFEANHRDLLRDFRQKLDQDFVELKNGYTESYAALIDQGKAEMRRATSHAAKLDAAFKLIQGVGVVATDSNKVLMFHETVVVGLNTLSAIERTLNTFQRFVASSNPADLEARIMDAIYAAIVVPGSKTGNPVFTAGTEAKIQAVLTPAELQAFVLGFTDAQKAALPDTYFNLGQIRAVGTTMDDRMEITGILVNDVYTWINAEIAVWTGVGVGAARNVIGPAAAQAAYYLGDGKRPSDYMDSPAGLTGEKKRLVASLMLFARLAINYNNMMGSFVENVFGITTPLQGLVDCRFVAGAAPTIQLNFTKLRGLCESLLADIKQHLELFRPYISKVTLDRFEGIGSPGSVYWIEKNLVDTFFRGTSDSDDSKTLDGMSKRLAESLRGLTRQHQTQFTAVAVAAAAPIPFTAGSFAGVVMAGLIGMDAWPSEVPSRYEDYGRAMSDLIYARFTAQLQALPAAASVYELKELITTNPAGALPKSRTPAPAPAAFIDAVPFPLYGSAMTATPGSHSLLLLFNQLVAQYLAVLTDKAGGLKIYLNLINSLANGVMSRSVTNPSGGAYPDMAEAAEAFGIRGDPDSSAILFESLAWVLQRLIKDTQAKTVIPTHLVATLSDVPMYMKDVYRANLPSFVKFFELISRKCDFIKEFMERILLNVRNPAPTGAAVATVVHNAAGNLDGAASVYSASLTTLRPFGTVAAPASERDNRIGYRMYLAGLIDAISLGAYTMSNAASEVLKELDDRPTFFQTGEGSIETYKIRYGKLPLMPLSLTTWLLNDLTTPAPVAGSFTITDTPLSPDEKGVGSSSFKILYGFRQLLRDGIVGAEQFPGVMNLLENYNSLAAQKDRIDPGAYAKFVQNVITAMRTITELRYFKAPLSAYGITNVDDVAAGTPGLCVPLRMIDAAPVVSGLISVMLAYPLKSPNPVNVISIVDSSNQEDSISRMTNTLGGGPQSVQRDRNRERLLNLIDANIIPINPHALMRGMPLANLYNYEFTFEQMAASVYGEQVDEKRNPTNTRQMFLRLLNDPYMEVSELQYGSEDKSLGSVGYVHRIFRGDNALGMGRPKFLSDQLFNKALFGSIVKDPRDFDEGGPSVSIGTSRGRNDVNLNEGSKHLQTIARVIPVLNDVRQELVTLGLQFGTTQGESNLNVAAYVTDASIAALVVALPNIVRKLASAARQLADVAETNAIGVLLNQAYINLSTVRTNSNPLIAYARVVLNPNQFRLMHLIKIYLAAMVACRSIAAPYGGQSNDIIQLATIPLAAGVGIAIDFAKNTAAVMLRNIVNMVLDPAAIFLPGPFAVQAAPADANVLAVMGALDTYIPLVLAIVRNRPLPLSYNGQVEADASITDIENHEAAEFVNNRANIRVLLQIVWGAGVRRNIINNSYPLLRDAVWRFQEQTLALDTLYRNRDGPLQVAARGAPPNRDLGVSVGHSAPHLTYPKIDDKDGDSVVRVVLPAGINVSDLDTIGKLRFDTRMIRNMFFITNVVRILRLKLNRDLTQSRNILVASHLAVAPGITEYGQDPFTPNESIGSKLPNGFDRYAA